MKCVLILLNDSLFDNLSHTDNRIGIFIMHKQLLKIVTLASFIFTPQLVAIEIAKHLTTIVNPEPIVRVAPKYPINAAKSKREGWAKLSFIIEKNGSVSNVLVTETSGSKDFANAAIKAVAKWQYKPAMENGEAIQQCANSVKMDFRMKNEGESAVTRRFKKKYTLALAALDKKDYPAVEQYIEKMFEIKYRHLTENNILHNLAAEYAEAINDPEKQLYHLDRITLGNNKSISPENKLSILNDRFLLAVKLNKFQKAYNSYKQLKKLDLAKPYLPKYEAVIAKVDNFIGGEQNIVIDANLKQQEFWRYSLVRNEFSLTDISGSLNKLDIRCANKRHVYSVENNNTWNIPKAWKNCSLFVYGEDDTSFKLVEHPIKS